MFKKIILAIGLSFLSVPAFAACTNPLTILNSASATVNMSVSQNTADAGCMYNVTPNQGGAPLSATNGWYTNILQGNAVLTAANGIYVNVGLGNAANASGNPLFAQLTAGSAGIGKVDPNTIATWGLAAIGGTTGSPTNALAAGCQYNSTSPTFTSGDVGGIQCTQAGSLHTTVDNTNSNGQKTSANSSPVVIASDQSAVPTTGAVNVTATDCSGTITAGGTAQNAFTAQTTLHGFTIMNIDTTEPLWISFTTTAAASGSGSYPLQAATATTFASPGSFTSPNGFGLNHALSVIAATTSHKFTCTWW